MCDIIEQDKATLNRRLYIIVVINNYLYCVTMRLYIGAIVYCCVVSYMLLSLFGFMLIRYFEETDDNNISTLILPWTITCDTILGITAILLKLYVY